MEQNMTRRAVVAALGGAVAAGATASAADAAGWEPKGVVRKSLPVLDTVMSYIEAGKGKPIVFLHGNPTSSYLWRNILPKLSALGRCLAPDLIGMGRSKMSPTFSYRFADHARYLDAWFDGLGLTRDVVLVIHDWGSALGFYRAFRNPEQIRGIVHMESLIGDRTWADFGPFEQAFRAIRSDDGVEMVLGQNFFIEQVMPGAVLRKLTDAELAVYRAPYPTRESRIPTLVWPREIPVDGSPADVAKIMADYGAWAASDKSPPKLFFEAVPGTMPPRAREFARSWANQKILTVKGVHYVQEDSPAEIASGIRDFLKSL